MKIAILVSGILKSKKESLSITVPALAEKLAELGHDVSIITRNKWGEPAIEKEKNVTYLKMLGINGITLYNKLLLFPLGVKRLQGMHRKRFDVIHSFSSSPALVLRSLFTRWIFARDSKVVHTLKSYPIKKDIKSKKGSRLHSILGDFSYKILNFSDYVTVSTKAHAMKLINMGVRKDKIHIIHSFIDLKKFSRKNKDKLKVKYGYTGKRIILHYGAMWEIKGTDILLDAIPAVVKANKNTKFIFIPRNTDAYKRYGKILEKEDIKGYTELIMRDVKIEDYVNMADIVAIPYPHMEGTEGNPSCLLEALACGTSVLSTDLPELKEIFSDCATLVRPGNSKAVAEAVIHLLSHKDDKKIRNGLKKVMKFDVNYVAEDFMKLYNSL